MKKSFPYNLYIRGQKTAPFRVRMNNGRSVFRSQKPQALARGASLLLILLVIPILLWGVNLFLRQGNWLRQKTWNDKMQLDYANTLSAKGLNVQAAAALEAYVEKSSADSQELSGVCYKLGTMYLQMNAYEKALGSFYKSEMLNPNASYKAEVNQKIVEALEKSGLTQQARYELNSRTQNTPVGQPQGAVVARVGKTEITEVQIDALINRLPPWSQNNLKTDEARYKFIKDYVAQEVLFEKAKKLGLDKEAQLRDTIDNIRKELLVQELMKREIMKNLKISEQDVELFYKANKEKYVDPESKKQFSFEEVKARVETEYRVQKQQDLVNSLLDKALEEEEVAIFFKPANPKPDANEKK